MDAADQVAHRWSKSGINIDPCHTRLVHVLIFVHQGTLANHDRSPGPDEDELGASLDTQEDIQAKAP
jgi:hypothetical protein